MCGARARAARTRGARRSVGLAPAHRPCSRRWGPQAARPRQALSPRRDRAHDHGVGQRRDERRDRALRRAGGGQRVDRTSRARTDEARRPGRFLADHARPRRGHGRVDAARADEASHGTRPGRDPEPRSLCLPPWSPRTAALSGSAASLARLEPLRAVSRAGPGASRRLEDAASSTGSGPMWASSRMPRRARSRSRCSRTARATGGRLSTSRVRSPSPNARRRSALVSSGSTRSAAPGSLTGARLFRSFPKS